MCNADMRVHKKNIFCSSILHHSNPKLKEENISKTLIIKMCVFYESKTYMMFYDALYKMELRSFAFVNYNMLHFY